MQVILNIGLARKNKPNLTVKQVAAVLEANGFWMTEAVVLPSDTEPTLVTVVDAHRAARHLPVSTGIYRASFALDQDCIAAYTMGKGKLIGPNACAWGTFNPEFFLLPDGSTLQTAAVAA